MITETKPILVGNGHTNTRTAPHRVVFAWALSGLRADFSGLQAELSVLQAELSGPQAELSGPQAELSGLQAEPGYNPNKSVFLGLLAWPLIWLIPADSPEQQPSK